MRQACSAVIPESEVVKFWKNMPGRTVLVDSEGFPVEVVYPGRSNDGRGADFRDAVIASAGTRRHGSIEIHSRTSHWQSHGHHRDPVYNQVVLHVAWQQDRAGRTVLENGLSVPTVILDQQKSGSTPCGRVSAALPCRNNFRGRTSGEILAILELAGDERFNQKARRFEKELGALGEGEVVYRGIMEALGYTRNTAAFRNLAMQVPLKDLESLALTSRGNRLALVRIQGLLLFKAGFFHSECLKGFLSPEHLYEIKTGGSVLYSDDVEDYPGWELFKVRPGNHPVVRLLSLSYLVLRYHKTGLLNSLLNLIFSLSPEKIGEELERALMVGIEVPEHDNPYIFLNSRGASPVLLGRDRVREIIVNVLLPFASARGLSLPGRCRENVYDLYRRYPSPATNSIERHMLAQIGMSGREINSACRQQGLLHIYKTFCARGKCDECPFGN